MKEIRYATFLGCSSLESVELPSGIEVIESQAFSYCTALRTIVIPYVDHIDGGAFFGCSELTVYCRPKNIQGYGKWASDVKEVIWGYKENDNA